MHVNRRVARPNREAVELAYVGIARRREKDVGHEGLLWYVPTAWGGFEQVIRAIVASISRKPAQRLDCQPSAAILIAAVEPRWTDDRRMPYAIRHQGHCRR